MSNNEDLFLQTKDIAPVSIIFCILVAIVFFGGKIAALASILIPIMVISILCTTTLIMSVCFWYVIKHFLGRKSK
jgi:Na+/alanine symporter